ncbi:MAG: hypothetical protein GC160_01650 [Acidobacteria bacterium]|nr:hypothetical protein [Acidobacteriota bacterium]
MALFVNNEEVPEGLLQAETQSLRARFAQLSPDQRAQYGFDDATMEMRAVEWARENVIERVLLRQEALRDESPLPAEALEAAVENMRQRFGGAEKMAEAGVSEETVREEAEAALRLDALLAQLKGRVKPAKSKDVASWYRKHMERWLVGESLRAAHIVKHVNEDATEEQARAAIDAAKAELDGGVSFEEVADRLSDCPGNGGDLGWFGQGKMVQEFEDVVFAMEPGQVSAVFRSPFGFHIAKVHDKKPPTTLPLNEVKQQIEAELRQERENQAVEEFVDQLRAKAKIEVLEPAKA